MTNYSNTLPQRDAGFENETNDCTVKALMVAAGVPYRDAHTFMAAQGRQARKGTYMSVQLLTWAREKKVIFGYRVTQVDAYRRADYRTGGWIKPTLAATMSKLNSGRFIVIKSRHAIGVVDGVIHDHPSIAGTRARVIAAYKFEASSIVEAREAKAAAELAAGYARYAACKAVNNGGF